jgi:hypothetical protein
MDITSPLRNNGEKFMLLRVMKDITEEYISGRNEFLREDIIQCYMVKFIGFTGNL